MWGQALTLNAGRGTGAVVDSGALLGAAREQKAQAAAKALSPRDAAKSLSELSAGLEAPQPSAPSDQRCAFWLNVYNALVIHAVLTFELRETVKELPRLFARVRYRLGAETFTLDDIEHGVLRGNRGHPAKPLLPQLWLWDRRRRHVLEELDPRRHFALNCGARSCPPIRCYEALELDAQLDMATRSFVQQDVDLDHDRRTVRLSRLFSWYRRDFGSNWQRRLAWIAPYLAEPDDRRALADGGAWSLDFRAFDLRLI
jgi:hypothetical protein